MEIQAFHPVPNELQYRYHDDELAAFLHFGMNVFTDREWGDGTEPLELFTPAGWHADRMVQALKEAGFKRLIVTAKHHDGFCLWHTAFTDHHVGNTAFGRDLLAEVSDACTKHGLDMGLYLSPWDMNAKSYGYGEGYDEATDTNGDYNDVYVGQIQEICENPRYGREGEFVEWWLDGAKGEGQMAQHYDFDRWIDAIRRGNKEILIFGAASEGGIFWVGNEEGFAHEPTWCKLSSAFREIGVQPRAQEDGDVWSVPEADVSINPGWFYHRNERAKRPGELGGIYLRSVGRGVPLLLNVPPTEEGDLAKDTYEALETFSRSWRETREAILEAVPEQLVTSSRGDVVPEALLHVFAKGDVAPTLSWLWEDPVEMHIVSVREPIRLGQRVASFELEVQSASTGEWLKASTGSTIGHLRMITLDLLPEGGQGQSYTGLRLRFRLTEGCDELPLECIALHRLAEAWNHQDLYETLAREAPGSVPGWQVEA